MRWDAEAIVRNMDGGGAAGLFFEMCPGREVAWGAHKGDLILQCGCGTVLRIFEESLFACPSAKDMADLLAAHIKAHRAQAARKLAPTLADFADWGWFAEDAP